MTQNERLVYLINYLLNESNKQNISIPKSKVELFNLYRALINVRSPKLIDKEFITIQNEMLQEELIQKYVINASNFDRGITLWKGDITRIKIDAIVNAANYQLLGCFVPNHHCIDNAIHTYAGVQLRNECASLMGKQLKPEPTGCAKITQAYNLPCKHVIHTVGPIINHKVTREDQMLLSSCYYHCLKLADKYKINSIAFCCISTGEYKFPKQLAAEIALKTINMYLSDTNTAIERVVINVFKEEDKSIYQRLLKTDRII